MSVGKIVTAIIGLAAVLSIAFAGLLIKELGEFFEDIDVWNDFE